MKFINSIREGDFVKLKTLEQLESEFGKPKKGGAIGSLFFGDSKNIDLGFFVYENVRKELGNVLRIKRVEYAKLSDKIFFNFLFEKQIVDSVLINGKWYNANDDLNVLYT